MGTILKMRTFLPLLAVLACAYGIADSGKPCNHQEADHLQSLSGLQQENINLKKAEGDDDDKGRWSCGDECWLNDAHNRDERARAADCMQCRWSYGVIIGTCYCCGCEC